MEKKEDMNEQTEVEIAHRCRPSDLLCVALQVISGDGMLAYAGR